MPGFLVFILSAVLLAGGCSVGKGVGAASGSLYAYGCSPSGDYSFSGVFGKELSPSPYDLKPSFFAGETIDDLREFSSASTNVIMRNRLIIRLQRSGKQLEQNDVLAFDVVNSYELARCVLGRVDKDTGKNDWNEDDCFRASDSGPGRMRLQYDSSVRATLSAKATCTANLVADAVSGPVPPSYTNAAKPIVTDGSWSSWVEFQEFGEASQSDRVPTERTAVKGTFRVELGERVYAPRFQVTLVDDAVVTAAINNIPKPDPMIGGMLGGDPSTGSFDFDLERGQGAQFFP